jgi:uncharacterized membrane protein (DUF485 family)
MPTKQDSDPKGASVWERVAASPAFHDLMAKKKAFIVPAFIFFVVYYFSLPILVGYAPQLMSRKVWGDVNIAYLFALSQFFMAWILAWIYIRKADGFDKLSKQTVEKAMNDASRKGGE